ncbi:hypothetical protein NEF87_003431 [Candidatus Lokiarchaeum ossiferum]|uniref:Uncharacterized protein n=1 Tax=Candidatus Lokiarchaeum ossiferum TaxID=2951803 RepID=A0ABY6HX37_9ARCH|nr:hypothetical protein NEF87_003431 [Candidatus Lokiarchaeum sp. B-35]
MNYVFPTTFFAYLDLLGFSQFVLNLSAQEEFQKDPFRKQQTLLYYYNVLEPLVNGSIFAHKSIPSPENVEPIKNYNNFKVKISELNSMIVSDSIFLWTDDLSIEGFTKLLHVVKSIINTNMLWDFGFPLRGGISMGSITYQRIDWETPKINAISTLVGDALVKAAAIEANQDWAGCMLDSEIVEYFKALDNSNDTIKYLEQQNLINHYKCPLKTVPSDAYVVKWPEVKGKVNLSLYDLPITMTFQRNGPILETSIQQKLQNTLDFVHSLQNILD